MGTPTAAANNHTPQKVRHLAPKWYFGFANRDTNQTSKRKSQQRIRYLWISQPTSSLPTFQQRRCQCSAAQCTPARYSGTLCERGCNDKTTHEMHTTQMQCTPTGTSSSWWCHTKSPFTLTSFRCMSLISPAILGLQWSENWANPAAIFLVFGGALGVASDVDEQRWPAAART